MSFIFLSLFQSNVQNDFDEASIADLDASWIFYLFIYSFLFIVNQKCRQWWKMIKYISPSRKLWSSPHDSLNNYNKTYIHTSRVFSNRSLECQINRERLPVFFLNIFISLFSVKIHLCSLSLFSSTQSLQPRILW